MKATLFAAICLVWATAHAENEKARRLMDVYGWNTDDVTFEDVGRSGQPFLIKRSGKVVGYYFEESVWERKDIITNALNGVTSIAYGYKTKDMPTLFKIEDKDEIKVWIAAYRNHTEFERRFSCFVPTDEDAGFELRRDEFGFRSVCMCSLALRFYVGDNEVLELKGHIQNDEMIDSGARNMLLHKLAMAKLPDVPEIVPADGEEPLINPFAEDPSPDTEKAEQGGVE